MIQERTAEATIKIGTLYSRIRFVRQCPSVTDLAEAKGHKNGLDLIHKLTIRKDYYKAFAIDGLSRTFAIYVLTPLGLKSFASLIGLNQADLENITTVSEYL